MNAHPEWQTALAIYRELGPAQRQALDAHLAGCDACREVLRAYQQQDRALGDIPWLRPRRRAWRQAPAGSGWSRRLGQGLALAGVAALLGVMALQLQYAGLLLMAGEGGTPASAVTETGIAIPPATVAPPSPWLPALPWIGLALLGLGLLFVLARGRRGPAIAGIALAVALLISYVPPLSALPNPAGLFWRVVGGYSYDPQLPFKNDFLIADRPERVMARYLDELVGEVGLTPLDPSLPLARYEILRVGLHPKHNRTVLVRVRFVYADGSSRVYPVPLKGAAVDVFGFWLMSWHEDGLQRLRSDHLALAGQPFADSGSPVRLGPAQRLEAVSPAANRLDEVNPSHWFWPSVRVQRLVWAPNGQAFLAAMETAPGQRQLWLVRLDGSEPGLLAGGDIREYGWAPDGLTVVATRVDVDAAQLDLFRPFAIVSIPTDGSSRAPIPLATRLSSEQLPGLGADGVWFMSDGSLWLAPYAGGQPRLVLADQDLPLVAGQPRPTPDGSGAAFACGNDLCLAAGLDTPQPDVRQVAGVEAAEMTWSADGQQLAVVDRDPNGRRPVRLIVMKLNGDQVLARDIAPADVTDAPQWTPDGQVVFVQTYPRNGRRIIAVELRSGSVLDLSQEHWDAYFALAPDGQGLLLNNGRGDFWVGPVIRQR